MTQTSIQKTRVESCFRFLRSSGDTHVANSDLNSVTTYRASANGDVKPIGILRGKSTRLNEPIGIAIR